MKRFRIYPVNLDYYLLLSLKKKMKPIPVTNCKKAMIFLKLGKSIESEVMIKLNP